jgi:hypothetical protein
MRMLAVCGDKPIAIVHRTKDSLTESSGFALDGSGSHTRMGVIRLALNINTAA